MIMSAVGLPAENPDPSEDEIRHGIDGNLCRCTGYHNIVRAIEYAAAKMRGDTRHPPNGRRCRYDHYTVVRQGDQAQGGSGADRRDRPLCGGRPAPRELSAIFVRSPYARAGVNSIDGSAALEMPGVHAVYTIEDVRHLVSLLAQVPVGT